jgi:hypothetical protein
VRFMDRFRPTATVQDEGAANPAGELVSERPTPRRPSLRSVATRILLHGGFLLISVGCLIAYEHFRAGGHSSASLVSLVAGAVLGFAPVRDVVRIVFKIEGKALHLAHGLGGLALGALPVAGVVSGAPVLTHAALAPFAIMGAAQAVMHQNHPRNARQAAALRTFATSLPEVAQFTSSKNLASPENARRAVAVLSDILAKAQALGETELQADPGFQSALRQVSTRLGANLGLDAVDLALAKLAAIPGTAAAVANLRTQLASARRTIAGGRSR